MTITTWAVCFGAFYALSAVVASLPGRTVTESDLTRRIHQ